MKNFFKICGVIAIVAATGFMTACAGDTDDNVFKVGDTVGSLTITDFPSAYHGKWVSVLGTNPSIMLMAAAAISPDRTTALGQISPTGSVTLKVWKYISESEIGNYNGSDEFYFSVDIANKATVSVNDNESSSLGSGYVTAAFSNGVASGNINMP